VAIGFASYFLLLVGWRGSLAVTVVAAALPIGFLLLNLRGVGEARAKKS
jgi:hypothetical protein